MTAVPARPDLDALAQLARRAGAEVMRIYRSDFAVAGKADASPVTEADVLAEAVILEGLAALDPHTPVVAEESVAAGRVPVVGACFWLVDPLDGTREFVQRNGEFTVNIARIEHGVPVAGVVYAPALEALYAGAAGQGAWLEAAEGEAIARRPIRCRACPDEGATVVASRSHGDPRDVDAFLRGVRVARRVQAGSSLKFGLVAAGQADLYPRLSRTMEWDTAAGHAVVAAAGGSVTTPEGAPFVYGKPGHANGAFVCRGLPPATRRAGG